MDDRSAEQRRSLKRIPLGARLFAGLLVLVMAVHTVIIGDWAAPRTPIQDEIGSENVRSYVLPWFEQNWSIFAPNPRRVTVTFEVRAMIEDPETGEEIVTDWVDMVEGEDQIVRYNPAPPRTSKIARRTTDNLNSARSPMNDDQLNQLQANYVEAPVEQLRDDLLSIDGGADADQVDAYMSLDEVAVSLATGMAHHAWEGEIVHVQYRTTHRPAPSYTQREEMTVDDTDRGIREYGWRAPADLAEEQIELFEPYARQAGAL